MRIEIPELCVVALIGASGSGKTTFAKRFFKSTEVLNSDFFRGMISDDENDQSVTSSAFDSLYYIANQRLNTGRLTVIDATNVQKEAREQIVNLAKSQNCFAVAIVLDYPANVCKEHNKNRSDRVIPEQAIMRQTRNLRQSLRYLKKEGFRYIYVIKSPEELEDLEIIRTPLWSNKKHEHGPFDIIGDIHGCYDELCSLLTKIGYDVDKANHNAIPPVGRKLILLGDLCDRGPKNIDVLKLAMNMTQTENALCIIGNHDVKLRRYLYNGKAQLTHGFDITVEEFSKETSEFKEKVDTFLNSLISHYVLDDGKLIVAHAGVKEAYQGRSSGKVRSFCLYGDTTGESDEYGLPVRLEWAADYRGKGLVVYGHTPTVNAELFNNTICIDTGCVFGGKLTCYSYPEGTLNSVPALKEYCVPVKPLIDKNNDHPYMLNIDDVIGKRYISTNLLNGIIVREENSAAALEVMSRFSVDPRWLIYLPPTMSPCKTSSLENYLEHPIEAFDYYKNNGVKQVVCEQKHMGSRAVIVLCKDSDTSKSRFGIDDKTFGVIYTRTGRNFFSNNNNEYETQILNRLNNTLNKTNFWKEFNTDWVCLDAEIMPWSAKAQLLLQEQYAPVGKSGISSLNAAVESLKKACTQNTISYETDKSTSGQNLDLSDILNRYETRKDSITKYIKAYQEYCWNVQGIEDFKIAPFHILATEGKVWNQENHLIHMDTIKKYMTGIDPIFMATNHILINLEDENSLKQGIDWWTNLTGIGGEGMVVKPIDFIAKDDNQKILQPAVKCRGKEYLRIIYGPEYLLPEHLERLKKRSLNRKQNLALSEFALGMESLERFVNNQPFHTVHECVFAVLAMESEPVDPRL